MNLMLGLVKWPCVAALALLAWGLAHELQGLALRLLQAPANLTRACVGALAYFVLWWMWMRKSPTSVVLATLEHEFAHLLACAVTFQPVTRIEAQSTGEGRVVLQGTGNWIVSAAPYVLPLPLVMPVTVLSTSAGHQAWPWIALGFSLGFHIHNTWKETHASQPDLRELGLCAWILLPACHVIVAAWVCGVMTENQSHFKRAAQESQQTLVKSWRFVASGRAARELQSGLDALKEKAQ